MPRTVQFINTEINMIVGRDEEGMGCGCSVSVWDSEKILEMG